MPDFPRLTFLPVDSLLIHERHDDQRTRPLVLRIRASGVWRNPPIVAPLRDGTPRYMVLDGANRVTSLVEMGFPHALVQVVEPDDPGLRLQNWNHVVWEMNAARFLNNIRCIDGLRLAQVPATTEAISPRLEGDCGLALVQTSRGRLYEVCAQADHLEKRVDLLNALVDSYKDHARLDRTNVQDIHPLVNVYPSLCGLVVFPHFDIWDLLKLAGQSYLLPTGITRFMISPRALHLNYPLEELADERSIEAKNQALHKWVQERLAHKQVRYYAEPTFLFDE
jgi:hypothetical protein